VRIYVLKDSKAQPVEVLLGITDGSKTEVAEGDLKENEAVIISMSSSAPGQTGVTNPFQPSRPRGFGFR
jgi:hypothetical protein